MCYMYLWVSCILWIHDAFRGLGVVWVGLWLYVVVWVGGNPGALRTGIQAAIYLMKVGYLIENAISCKPVSACWLGRCYVWLRPQTSKQVALVIKRLFFPPFLSNPHQRWFLLRPNEVVALVVIGLSFKAILEIGLREGPFCTLGCLYNHVLYKYCMPRNLTCYPSKREIQTAVYVLTLSHWGKISTFAVCCIYKHVDPINMLLWEGNFQLRIYFFAVIMENIYIALDLEQREKLFLFWMEAII